jgi:ATP/maltotriose-dependent transcriptional regulator MalT
LDAAASTFQRALDVWSDLRYEQGRAQTLRNLAEVALETGDIARSLNLVHEALTLAERISQPWMAMGAAVTLGQVLLAKGEINAAFDRFVYAEEVHTVGLRYWHPFISLGFAICARLTGDPGRAVDMARKAATDVRPRVRGQALLELARANVELGDRITARRYAGEAADMAQRHGYRLDFERAMALQRT